MADQTDRSEVETALGQNADDGREAWVKPDFVTFLPVSGAEGISYRPSDGISNLS